jgi:hypothetical protein
MVPKVRFGISIVVTVAMAALCRTRIRYTHLLAHLVGGDMASGVEEGGDSSVAAFMEWWISSSLRVLEIWC